MRNIENSGAIMYIVHMKTVKASEARKRWFHLLDEALRGEVIAVERNGQRVVLRREPGADRVIKGSPDYKRLLKVPQADQADRWSWEWRPDRALRLRRRSGR